MSEPEVPLSRRAAREAEAAAQAAAANSPATGAVPPAVPPAVPTDVPTQAYTPPPEYTPTDAFTPTQAYTPPPEYVPTQAFTTPGADAPTQAMSSWDLTPPTERMPAPVAGPAGTPGGTPVGGEPGRGGIAALIKKHPTAWLASALGVAFLLLGTGAVFAGMAVGGAPASDGVSSVGPVVDDARSVPSELPAASLLRTCTVAPLATDPAIADLSGSVINAATGEVLFDRNGATALPAASVQKIFTASAAINALGADYRISTKVYDGSTEGSVVLVGGGDPTLNSLPTGQENVYEGSASLEDLADQVRAAYKEAHPDGEITSIVLDTSLWNTADKWDGSWNRRDQTSGYMSEVTPLQVDGDRQDPTESVSPRSTDPVMRAGTAFAYALGLEDAKFSLGAAITSKPILGQVQSQPVSTLIDQMLIMSDGSLAESLARLVSKSLGFDGSAASLQQAITGAIANFSVETTGVVIKDGSGLSTLNAIPAAVMSQFLAKVYSGTQDLNYVYNSLAVSGETGGLAKRFTGANEIARGAVTAKVGTLDNEHSLAGVVVAADGTPLAFTFYAIRSGITQSARTALDTLVTGLYSCGNNLSNN